MEMFKIEDIKDGYFLEVEEEKGDTFTAQVFHNNDDELVLSDGKNYETLCHFDSELCDNVSPNWKIKKIYGRAPSEDVYGFLSIQRKLLWNRDQIKKEMTIEEIESELGHGVKIVKEHV